MWHIELEPYLGITLEPDGAPPAVALLVFGAETAIDAVQRVTLNRYWIFETIHPRLLVLIFLLPAPPILPIVVVGKARRVLRDEIEIERGREI